MYNIFSFLCQICQLREYNLYIMSVRTSIKMLLLQENMTLTELARLAAEAAQSKYTVDSLSRKLQNETMKYNEAEFLINTMGYKIKFEKET